ncbi:multi-sensor hybrid histidine kinase [Tolypothrix tenuis PCC 7101]|uniref:Circadian input-output histidine kinase CikA n=1 Tax=Tolypothrix tenuis PCC 7101 TaxID=231146 RepID=A0A1Z4MXB5_9CYAN|nr:GAF domain-containing protein [Aulosira sp. FACHB-113]BAY98079.1 multi-sensor hybrid histidine kinase [Tolypothrix tenuis PCC 7101]BAZ78002.1 multi-sensor hybrid histidine kinase [Aulosira laxa NIES-50]
MFKHTKALTTSELKSAIVRNPLIVGLDTLVIEAIALMSGVQAVCDAAKVDELHLNARASCVLVVNDNKLLGILTERDVVSLCAQQRPLENLAIREVMIHPVIALHESDFTDVFFAVNLLQQYHIRHLPILDEQDLVVGLLTNETLRQSSRAINLLRLRLAFEVMSREVICAAPDSSILAIAQLMTAHRVSSVMIVQTGGSEAAPLKIPVGILTERDIVQFHALGLNLETCCAHMVMSTPIFAVKPEDSLLVVQQIMEQRLIRRLAVTGEQGELLGILTQSSLLQALNPLELYKLAEVLEKKVVQLETEKVQLLEARTAELEQQVEARTTALKTKAEQAQLVSDIAMQIRSSLSLQTILETTVQQVRQFLGCDRVIILRFEEDGPAAVVAESTNSALSLIGRCIKDGCFQKDYRENYRYGQIRVVQDIYTTQMTDCHRQMLISLQIRAKILIPLLCNGELWGLLNVSESDKTREWQQSEVELLQALSVHLEIALQQATIHQQLQEQLRDRQRAEMTLQKLVTGTAAVTGDDFFPALVSHIAEALNVCCALVNELVGDKLYSLGFWENGALQPAISYHIAQTPCEHSLRDGEFYCQSQLQTIFPDNLALQTMQADSYLGIALKDNLGNTIGNLCILDKQPLSQPKYNEAIAILQVFAARAAAELQRIAANDALHRLNQDLEARVEQRTEELQAREVELQKISERLALSLKSGGIGCWEWDILQNTILWDERMYELYGVTPQSNSHIIYDTWTNKLHPDDRKPTETLLQQAVLGQAEYDTEFRVVHLDGSIYFIKAYGVVVRDSQGNPQKMIGVHFDISDRKRAELALHSSEQRFRRMFDSNVVGMLFADFQGDILDANDRFLQMLGYTREELNAGAMNWKAITPPEYTSADVAALKHLSQYGAMNPWEKEYYRKDGSKIPVLLGVAMLPGSDRQTICVVVDISEQKAALWEREQAQMQLQQQARHKQLLWNITQTIRQSLDIGVIINAAVTEVRQVLGVDRVALYRFQPNWSGEFIAESVTANWVKLVGSQVKKVWEDTYLQETEGGRFQNYETLVVADIDQAGLQPCHIELLQQFQAKAYVITPIFVNESLWGLFAMYHNHRPHSWTTWEIELLRQIANQLAIAIQQASLYEKNQSELLVRQQAEARIALQLRRQQTLGAIIEQIRKSLDLNEILATVTQQVKDLMHCDRVIVFRLFANGRSQIAEEAVSAEFVSLKNRHWDNEVWSQDILDFYWQGQPRIVPDVMNDIWTHCLVGYSQEGQIKSKIVAPILQEVRNQNHRWVSPWATNKLWGILVVHACQERRVWKNSEAQILQQIANQLAIAIQQANLFEQLQQELAERQQAEAKLTEINQQLAFSNEELARATRLKDEFLANMSHELRTPLNAILGMTEGLQDEVFGSINQQQLKALDTIERSGSHLLELINDILDVAKIEAGQIKLDYTSISITNLCQSSLAFIKQQALQKRIQLETKIPQNLPNLIVDERRIRQVLINLLNNAVKFTPEGGQITLEVNQLAPDIANNSLEQHFLQIAVKDTGIGIAQANINKLFKPFIQIDSALNRQYAGTGLGLALVKRIVELHGGRVGLSSELGVGSCFTIELPYTPVLTVVEDTQPDVTPEFVCSNLDHASPLILLAEDNEANISTVSSYLQAKGYRILLANNGKEAIELATTQCPNLILMDIQMPLMDGLEAIKLIRLDPNLVNTPIVALTALAMNGDRDRCIAAGANDYLSKPVKLKQLATTIQQLLST